MVKKAIKAAIRLTRKWLEEPSAPDVHDYSQDPHAYPWLNALLDQIVASEGGAQRPAYAWGVLHGAYLAKALGVTQVSVIEFGVAGGNGLVALEKIAMKVAGLCGVGIDVYGFDTGVGLPKPVDYRDLPNLYTPGDFPMDRNALQARLAKAHLILGPVEETLPAFLHTQHAPIAFISVDVDFYSSTVQALKVLEADHPALLPRIHCYFDDILGFTFSDYTGERLAIAEFNASHTLRKISPIYGLKYFVSPQHSQAAWLDMSYMAHIFDHDLYGHNDGLSHLQQLPLKK